MSPLQALIRRAVESNRPHMHVYGVDDVVCPLGRARASLSVEIAAGAVGSRTADISWPLRRFLDLEQHLRRRKLLL